MLRALWRKVGPSTPCRKMGWLTVCLLLLAAACHLRGLTAGGTGGGRFCQRPGSEPDARSVECAAGGVDEGEGHPESPSYEAATPRRGGGGRERKDVGFLFCRVERYPGLVPKLGVMLESLLNLSSVDVRFHVFVCDEAGFEKSVEVLERVAKKLDIETPEVVKESITELLKDRLEQARHLQSQVSRPGTYYHDELFVLAPFLHGLAGGSGGRNVSRLLMLDVDLKFLADVADLFAEFDRFPESAFFGVAPELSPVYYHMLYKFRKLNPATALGTNEPKHMQGVNTGVLLVDVDKMRGSAAYDGYLRPEAVTALFDKYRVDGRGHLGDQDFLALLSFEHPELFHFLDCGWNRALCQFWRKVYPEVFDAYFRCDGEVKIYHGNCDSPIPPS